MGRRPKVAIEGAEAPVATTTVRRTRRSRIIDHALQGQILLASLLKSRSERGATRDEALAVVQWARGVHAEAADLKALSTQVRKAKAENFAERQVALKLNQTLLEGVIAGTLAIDVNEAGAISFTAL